DTSNAAELTGQLASLSNEHGRLVLDLSRVQFVDSSGCGALIAGNRKFHEAGGELRLCNPTTAVKTVLVIARLNRVLNLHDSREHALAAFAD
ncbi:MAG: STAS domain-containing protein, partial [Gemmataceae bacterium]|nr:STAS domain-containing protein [Gemmataceae bacterium]